MKNFDRSEVLSFISDLYKDVNGVRPRFYNFNEWSDAELEAFTDQLEAQLKENLEFLLKEHLLIGLLYQSGLNRFPYILKTNLVMQRKFLDFV